MYLHITARIWLHALCSTCTRVYIVHVTARIVVGYAKYTCMITGVKTDRYVIGRGWVTHGETKSSVALWQNILASHHAPRQLFPVGALLRWGLADTRHRSLKFRRVRLPSRQAALSHEILAYRPAAKFKKKMVQKDHRSHTVLSDLLCSLSLSRSRW